MFLRNFIAYFIKNTKCAFEKTGNSIFCGFSYILCRVKQVCCLACEATSRKETLITRLYKKIEKFQGVKTSMDKNRIRPIKVGKGVRMSYSKQKEVLEMPNLIEVQKDSYQWFLEEGLNEVFDDISPIEDYSDHLSLEFVSFQLCEDDVKYSIEECKERDATYAAPLKVKVRLRNKETEEINEHDIFMGDLPLMTETGTFVINGAERVIVSQLVRSPGIYYAIQHDKVGKTLHSSTVIPNRGAWLEYETDSNDVFYVRVDRNRKVPITVLLRAMVSVPTLKLLRCLVKNQRF